MSAARLFAKLSRTKDSVAASAGSCHWLIPVWEVLKQLLFMSPMDIPVPAVQQVYLLRPVLSLTALQEEVLFLQKIRECSQPARGGPALLIRTVI